MRRRKSINRKAVIESCDCYLLKTIPLLTGQGQFVLCEDGSGNRFACPEDFWLRHVPKPEATALVYAGSTSQEKIDFFLSLFRGRDSLYAKRCYNLKTGRSGYVPACQNEWQSWICDKKAYRCPRLHKSVVQAVDYTNCQDAFAGKRYQSIVWYGNVEYLSYSMKDANDEPEQLHMEMSV